MVLPIKVAEDPKWGLTSRTGVIDLDAEVRDPELSRELLKATYDFVRSMELQGFALYKYPGFDNPTWISFPDGTPKAYYAIDWEGKRRKMGPDGDYLPNYRETSLEDSEGMVEYRIIGIFWNRQRTVEHLASKYDIYAAERAARKPVVFGPGGK